MKHILKKTYTFLGILFALSSAEAHFGSKGPFGGSVSAATSNGNTVYIGTAEGGVYESTDSTVVTWRARPVGLKSGKITALAHTGSYLFAATADSGIYRFTGIDVNGSDRYWEKKNNGLENLNINSLIAIDSITLLAGTSGEPGIYLSSDKGNTWTKADGPILHHYEITGFVKAGNRVIHASLDGGLWASNDLGQSWYDFNDDNTLHIAGTSAVSYNSTTDEILVVNVDGLFKAKVGTGNDPVFSKVISGLPSSYEVRAISNDGSSWYLATNKGVFTSPASAISWSVANTGLSTTDITAVLPFKSLVVAGTSKEGIYKIAKTAIGTAWTAAVNGFNNLATYAGTTTGTDIAVVATEKGVFVSKNVTASVAVYVRANTGLTDSLHVNDLIFADFCLLAATQNAGVFFSVDTGKSWTAASNGLPNKDIRKLYFNNGVKYAICSNGNLYSSPLHSYDWVSEQHDLASGIKASALAFYNNKLLLGTESNGVYSKVLSSMNWIVSNTGLTNLKVTSLALQKDKVFLGTDGSGVWLSDTASLNWTATTKINIPHISLIGLDAVRIQSLASNGNFIFAGYKGGLVASYDFGLNWQPAGAQYNLPSFTNVRKISFVEAKGTVAGRVFVTTENNLLYSNSLGELKTDLTALYETSLSLGCTLAPNPNKGSFRLFSNGLKVNSIEIIDMQGRKVVALGADALELISLDLNKGMYLVRINAAQGTQIEKMMVE